MASTISGKRIEKCGRKGNMMKWYPYGASESVNLELYLMWRARGMPVETPAVRP